MERISVDVEESDNLSVSTVIAQKYLTLEFIEAFTVIPNCLIIDVFYEYPTQTNYDVQVVLLQTSVN